MVAHHGPSRPRRRRARTTLSGSRPLVLALLGLALLAACTDPSSGVSAASTVAGPTSAAPPGRGAAPHVAGAAALPGAARPGPSWQIPPGHAGGIQGYADRAGIAAGSPVTLYVSTAAPSFVVRAFRMGWYAGAEGRQTWVSPAVRGVRQPAAVLGPPPTRTVTAPWSPSLTIDTAGWEPGDYLLRLDASTGGESFVPLSVRTRSAAGRAVLISPVTTWQAYNTWGCCDLYAGADGSFGSRSRAVSFDRPYAAEQGTGDFLRGELSVLAEASRLRLRLDFVTDVDLRAVPGLLDGARAVVSMGHDEYWSPGMRAALSAARDAGTNLAFLGANAIFRRIRFAATSLGPNRLEINYKVASEDPLDGVDPARVTADWPAPPDPRPESSLLGAQYGCYLGFGHNPPGVVVDPVPWLFAGTSATRGQTLPGLIGPETDAVQPNAYPTPRPIEVLLHSPTSGCPNGVPPAADTSYYVAPGGAGVFDAGTIAWACAIAARCASPIPPRTQAVTERVTANLLRTFAQGPAGRAHPAVDNLDSLPPPGG